MRARRGAQIVRLGHRHEAGLGRAVEVEEHVAEVVHDLVPSGRRERRADREDRRAASACRTSRASLGPSASTRWSIVGTTAVVVTPWRSTSSRKASGLNSSMSTAVPPRMRVKTKKPNAVEW